MTQRGLCFSFSVIFIFKVAGDTRLHYRLLTCYIGGQEQSHFDIWQFKLIALLKMEGKLAGLAGQPIEEICLRVSAPCSPHHLLESSSGTQTDEITAAAIDLGQVKGLVLLGNEESVSGKWEIGICHLSAN